MKIYFALIRVVLFCVTLALFVIGGLFFIQNWEGGKLMLGIGVALSAIILIDLLRTKKVL